MSAKHRDGLRRVRRGVRGVQGAHAAQRPQSTDADKTDREGWRARRGDLQSCRIGGSLLGNSDRSIIMGTTRGWASARRRRKNEAELCADG